MSESDNALLAMFEEEEQIDSEQSLFEAAAADEKKSVDN